MSKATPPAARLQIFIWALFDLANTSFSLLILTVAYPVYFITVVAGHRNDAEFLWGAAFSISMLVTALISPVLGAIADHSAGKKRFLLYFTLLCIIAMALLYFTGEYTIATGMLLLILANIGFEAGLVFYDAYLPEITTEKSYGRVSGYGFAMGYIGAILVLLLAYPFLKDGFIPENLHNVRMSFPLGALFFFIFAIPIFFVLRDSKKNVGREESYFVIGIKRVRNTLKNIREYRNVGKFLFSYFIYMDGIHTVIIFASIYASTTLGFSMVEILIFFLTVQSTAIVGAAGFGILADSIGRKNTLSITLLLWIAVVLLAFFTSDKVSFYIVGLIAGAAMGSSQAISRSLMSTIIPLHKKTEFFGFYSFFGKSSAIIGPLLFGLLSTIFTQKAALLSLTLFFTSGLILLQSVKEEPYSKITTEHS